MISFSLLSSQQQVIITLSTLAHTHTRVCLLTVLLWLILLLYPWWRVSCSVTQIQVNRSFSMQFLEQLLYRRVRLAWKNLFKVINDHSGYSSQAFSRYFNLKSGGRGDDDQWIGQRKCVDGTRKTMHKERGRRSMHTHEPKMFKKGGRRGNAQNSLWIWMTKRISAQDHTPVLIILSILLFFFFPNSVVHFFLLTTGPCVGISSVWHCWPQFECNSFWGHQTHTFV